MRAEYEPPEIEQLGTVAELTQANFFGPASDNLFILRGPEEDGFS
ncbi:MAG: lasso RiPP family leader peptide-containing protein [Thermocrispum sp.]